MASPSADHVEPERAEGVDVSVAWLVAPVPFTTETVTDDGAGSGLPVIESMVGADAEHLVDGALVLCLRPGTRRRRSPPW